MFTVKATVGQSSRIDYVHSGNKKVKHSLKIMENKHIILISELINFNKHKLSIMILLYFNPKISAGLNREKNFSLVTHVIVHKIYMLASQKWKLFPQFLASQTCRRFYISDQRKKIFWILNCRL